jgi:1,4-alpha-glucan branching enzyme
MTDASIENGKLDQDTANALAAGRHGDPFAVLGPHETPQGTVVRACLPGASNVEVVARADGRRLGELSPGATECVFEGLVKPFAPYRLRVAWSGAAEETEDPYAFGPLLSDFDLYLIGEGRHYELAGALGASVATIDGVNGVRFAVWAPNASRVSVVGDFNSWDERRHPMRLRPNAGIWEIFIPRVPSGARYKYAIVTSDGRRLPFKADPLAKATETPPSTASVVPSAEVHRWHDMEWMASRAARHAKDAPISIYEVHAGSWLSLPACEHRLSIWEHLERTLVPYVSEMGFTQVELLPISEHPFGGSWGYQPLGLFAPSARYGTPEEFARFVDACHAAGIGVILDWVPAHFPTDEHGLARFDGTALYEHLDPREGIQRDWNTYIYNFGRNEVQGFLIASALHWLEHFHVDGLRVDAVASMLYRDYSRAQGEWSPNIYGGRENLEAVSFIRHLNSVVAERCPGAMMIAEESTAWPGVTRPVAEGGLGFTYKWNMGWMNDTLRYMAHDPIHRAWHHDDMTFGLIYAFSEKFILPLSHDEVVHGKGSLLGRMPGDRWRRFANMRAYLGFMWGHPGKKLIFMGGEIAQEREWSHDRQIDWYLADNTQHEGMRRLLRDLNLAYVREPALHRRDCDPEGFAWIVGDDRSNSVFAFLRTSPGDIAPILVVCNMTPVPRERYRVGVPKAAQWREIINTDAALYGGSNLGNGGVVEPIACPSHGRPCSLELVLPPLATLILRAEG